MALSYIQRCLSHHKFLFASSEAVAREKNCYLSHFTQRATVTLKASKALQTLFTISFSQQKHCPDPTSERWLEQSKSSSLASLHMIMRKLMLLAFLSCCQCVSFLSDNKKKNGPFKRGGACSVLVQSWLRLRANPRQLSSTRMR